MTPPSTIAHYRISGKLGEGGMGAVYRATDTKLGREVAIKVLPDAFAADGDRVARFTREAKVLASLNHPNIAAIYGVEDRALIMEFVEGHDLRGPLPIATALNYARQIAGALDFAHEKGIVHRDLKPANIRITPDGVVKVLDFGLAKLAEPATGSAATSDSPTMTSSHTRTGIIMGTAAYMSPEQARGQKVDKRADIWSFGVVLYEMLAGRKLFGGDTVSDTLAAVLKTDPDWSALPPDTPPAIRRLLRRCLDRDRKQRLADIADSRLEIDEAMGGALESPALAAVPRARAALRWWSAAVALVALAGLAVAVEHFRETPQQQPAAVRFQVPVPEKATFGDRGLALSPDGRQLAFIATGADGRPMLWVRPLDSVTAHALPGTEGADYLPFWSPDSRSIGFPVQGKVKRIEAAGGSPQTLCEVPGAVVGGSWSRDGVIIFGPASGGLFRVPQAGGAPARLTTSDQAHGEIGHLRPWFLPDGRHFLYFSRTINPELVGIYLATLDGTERKRLAATNQAGAYAPPAAGSQNGHLLFLREATLMALPLDAKRFEPAGEPFPLVEQVGSWLAMGFFSVSANGVLAYRNGAPASGSQLVWFDRQGKALGPIGPPGNYYSGPTLSPDGNRVAVDQMETAGPREIWIVDVLRGVPTRFTFNSVQNSSPAWSPNGTRVVFRSARGAAGTDGIYQKDSSGTGKEELLLPSASNLMVPNAWSPNGRYILFSALGQKTGSDLWVLPAATGALPGSKPVPYLQESYNERQGQFSPDGRWIAYSSDETGSFQVYVQSFPAGAGKFQVSTDGGSQPRWRRDGKEIFYIGAAARLTAVNVKTAPNFEYGAPQSLFPLQIPFASLADENFHYDVAADGKRFLLPAIATGTGAAPNPITVIVNWAALKR